MTRGYAAGHCAGRLTFFAILPPNEGNRKLRPAEPTSLVKNNERVRIPTEVPEPLLLISVEPADNNSAIPVEFDE